MGSVWLAERTDGLFKRQVALKLVHSALVSRVTAERFAREREILASLSHPNIARLLDAGIADEGQPYLALEYIVGTPIAAYCDERKLTIAQRLALFQQVLAAVQYAHSHLVIHRDLKSTNILVSEDGQVHLLDFGIAKLLTEGQARETELTQLGGRALTPDFAAPEQITGGAIGTAADVYSLGILLYGLLTGERPYRLKSESRGALEQAILETDPILPSRTLLTEAAARNRVNHGAQAHFDPAGRSRHDRHEGVEEVACGAVYDGQLVCGGPRRATWQESRFSPSATACATARSSLPCGIGLESGLSRFCC